MAFTRKINNKKYKFAFVLYNLLNIEQEYKFN